MLCVRHWQLKQGEWSNFMFTWIADHSLRGICRRGKNEKQRLGPLICTMWHYLRQMQGIFHWRCCRYKLPKNEWELSKKWLVHTTVTLLICFVREWTKTLYRYMGEIVESLRQADWAGKLRKDRKSLNGSESSLLWSSISKMLGNQWK